MPLRADLFRLLVCALCLASAACRGGSEEPGEASEGSSPDEGEAGDTGEPVAPGDETILVQLPLRLVEDRHSGTGG